MKSLIYGKKRNIRKSLVLTDIQWSRLNELARLSASVVVSGPNPGTPSWRVFVRRIADARNFDDLIELLAPLANADLENV